MSADVVVLVIDDDAEVRELVCDVLKSAGYEVDSVDSSSAGYDRLCAGGVDVIVCDVMLPGELGPLMIERFNFNSTGHSVPAVYISGYDWKTLVKERILPVDAPFLQKPLDLFDLIRWVQRLILKGKLED